LGDVVVQCPCGRVIRDARDYRLVFLRRGALEIDILCPNDSCYLKELGYIRFRVDNGRIRLVRAEFYPPFVTWNAGRLGFDVASKILREHLRIIIREVVDWNRIRELVKE